MVRGQRYLMAPPGDRGHHVATGWVPLHIRGHVVLCYVHQGAVWRVHESKRSIHTENKHTHRLCIDNCIQHTAWISKSESQARSSTNWPPETSQHQELSLGAPEYAVGLLLVKHLCIKKTWQRCFMNTGWNTTGSTGQLDGRGPVHQVLTQELDLSVIFDMIKGDADSRWLSVENSKFAVIGFPGKCYDAFWKRGKQTVHRASAPCSLNLVSLYPHLSSPPRPRAPASLSFGRSQSW